MIILQFLFYLKWIRYLNHFGPHSIFLSLQDVGKYKVLWRMKVCEFGGMSVKSYMMTNILTTVPNGLNKVTWTVPIFGTLYPFLPKLICPFKNKNNFTINKESLNLNWNLYLLDKVMNYFRGCKRKRLQGKLNVEERMIRLHLILP